MKKKDELNINDVLNSNTEPVQSLKVAVQEKTEAEEIAEFASKFIGKGRPKVDDKNKKKARSLYLSDLEIEKIEKISKINGMNVMEFVRFALLKELRKEGIEL